MLRRRFVVLGMAAATAVAVALPATGQVVPIDEVLGPVDDVLDQAASAAGLCDDRDTTDCLLPFPSDVFTAEADTPTGLRIDFAQPAMPRNVAGVPVDPTEWNRNDGWSPGSALLTFVPGLDLGQTFGIEVPQLEVPSLSLAPDAPIVIVDSVTGQRHPYWAELDQHPDTDPAEALLIIRPLVNFTEGHRYVVGLRNLKDASGDVIAPTDFDTGAVDADVLDPLATAGVAADELFLAWDFTIASEANLAGRALAIRDHAFSLLGDDDLADGIVAGDSPGWTVTSVEEIDDPEHDTLRIVEATVTVPYYLDRPDELQSPELVIPSPIGDELPIDEVPQQYVPGSRFNYDASSPEPSDVPVQNAQTPTFDIEITCSVPRASSAAAPALPTLYGHGLLGSRGESRGSSTERMREAGYLMCGVDWFGFYERDIANVLVTLEEISNFASVADRMQQGFVNFLYVGRALIHPEGITTHEAFTDEAGAPLVDTTELFYDGNSQGGIMGGALVALAPDFTKATLGVLGMNYSTLLHRSVDFEGTLADEVPIGYSTFLYNAYPSKTDQLVVMNLLQMLWDRGEGNGYAAHLTDDPLPNTPPHQVLMHSAWGDYQVANISAEVEARSAGARFLQTALPPGRHWADGAGDRLFGFEPFDVAPDGSLLPHTGSALVHWDSANPTPPSANIPPEHNDEDPHSDPRKDPLGMVQKDTFYRTGQIVDVHAGLPYCTFAFPRDESVAYDCTLGTAAPAEPAPDPGDGGAGGPAGPDPAPDPIVDNPNETPRTGGGLAALGALALAASRSLRRR